MIQMEKHEDNLGNAVSSDDEDPLEEHEAKLRSIQFLKQRESSAEDGEGQKADVKRYDEMGSSFLVRNEVSNCLISRLRPKKWRIAACRSKKLQKKSMPSHPCPWKKQERITWGKKIFVASILTWSSRP